MPSDGESQTFERRGQSSEKPDGRGKSTKNRWRLWSRVTRTAAGSHGGKVTKQL